MQQRNQILVIVVLTIACSEQEGGDVEHNQAATGTADAAQPSPPRSSDFTTHGSTQTIPDAGNHIGASHPTGSSLRNDSRDGAVGGFDPDSPDAALSSGAVDVSSNTQLEASSSMGANEVSTLVEQDAPDAGSQSSTSNSDEPAAETGQRTCSIDPLDTVTWECTEQGDDCITPVNLNKCPLPWDCETYSLAVKAATDQCSPSIEHVTFKACDLRIIERRTSTGDPLRAFYVSSGDLIGTWSTTNAGDVERCSGTIPEACLDRDLANRIGSDSLCGTDENSLYSRVGRRSKGSKL